MTKLTDKQTIDDLKEIKFKDIFGNEIKPLYCLDCNKDISRIAHHKDGYCLACAFKRELIK